MNENYSFKQKAADFFEKKGFYVVLMACLAVVGATAYFTFAGLEDAPVEAPPIEVRQSTDQALDEVIASPQFSQPEAALPKLEPLPTIAPVQASADFAAPAAAPEAAQTAAKSKKALYDAPVSGSVLLPFADDSLVYSKTLNQWTSHSGIDIQADEGAEVKCIGAGVVASVKNDPLMGNTVVVEHDGSILSTYSALAALPELKEGDKLKKGQVIGVVGNSALNECSSPAHLHFELRVDGKAVDPKDYLIGITKPAA